MDPSEWTCGCGSFFVRRFLICKHILCCFEDIQNPVAFFSKIRRQSHSPSWVEQQLVLGPQYLSSSTSVALYFEQDSNHESYTMEYGLCDLEEESKGLVEFEDDTTNIIAARIKSSLDAVKVVLDEQAEIGNTKLL